jgi:ribosomal protein S18 acetylase RimI-like enzyme
MLQRGYAGPGDYAAMHEVLAAANQEAMLRCYGVRGDIDWWTGGSADPDATLARVQIFEEEGQVQGFVWSNDGGFDMLVRPDRRALEQTMIEWALATLPGEGPAGEAKQIEVNCFDGDEERAARLRAAGFVPGEAYYIFNDHSLAGALPLATLPPGYRLRSFAGEDEIEDRVTVHRTAFHPSKMTVAKHRKVMTMPLYRQALDLVIEAPVDAPSRNSPDPETGEPATCFAAYTIVWFDPVNRLGLFEPVGTHPQHRRKGLGRALLAAGMRELQALGASMAYINSNNADSQGAKLYRAAGFSIEKINRFWTCNKSETKQGDSL